MRCEDFLSWLEDPALQEGGPWPQEILLHARRCSRCAEVLAIFQAIPGEVAHLPRASGDDEDPPAVLITVHEGIPAIPPSRRHRIVTRLALAAAAALLGMLSPWHTLSLLSEDCSAPDGTPLVAEIDRPTPALPADDGPYGPFAAPAVEDALAEASEESPRRVRPGRRSSQEPAALLVATLEPATPVELVMPPPRLAAAPDRAARTTASSPDDEATSAGTHRGDAEAYDGTARLAERDRARNEIEVPRVRVGQGVVVMSEDWGTGTGYGGEVGIQQRFWFGRHAGMSVDGGVRYGVAPGFDALPDDKPRTTTGGTVAGAGSVMFAVRARPAMVGLGVGFSAGEWDPGPDACSDLQRAVPERNGACDEWSYVTPDLVASVEFDVSRDVRLGVRWTGHDQGYELGRNGEVPTEGAWINRVTLEATFRPGADSMQLLAKKNRRDLDGDRGDTGTLTAISAD